MRVHFVLVFLNSILLFDYTSSKSKAKLKHTYYVFLLVVVLVFSLFFVISQKKSNSLYLFVNTIANIKYDHTISVSTHIPYPVKTKQIPQPVIGAKSFIVYDVKNDKVLLEKNSQQVFPPASTTKLMTALVAQDLYSLDDKLAVPLVCTQLDAIKTGFYAGEIVSVKDLLYTLLVNSSGDSACTLAYGRGDYNDFILKMNQKALELKLLNTHFTNPVGFDDTYSNHVSSAYDLYLLGKSAMKSEVISNIVKTTQYTTETGTFPRTVYTTNQLLNTIPQTTGIKTGTTFEAGEVLIYRYNNKKNIDLIIVLMGSVNRFEETEALLNWILNSYNFG